MGGAAVGAAVNEAVRQERPSLVDSLQNASVADTVVPLSSGKLFADGPVENVLISGAGRRPEVSAILTIIQTAETFELSFDITPYSYAPPYSLRNILHLEVMTVRGCPHSGCILAATGSRWT